MVRALVLHIGDPGAGAAAIQQRLAAAPEPGGDGIDPPAWCYPALRNHDGLARALQTEDDPARADRRFGRIARHMARSEAEVGILSAEGFARVDPRRLRDRIARHFPDLMDRLRLVAYVRPHAEQLLSAHARAVASGRGADSLEAFLARTLAERRLLCFDRFMAWRDVFGSDFVLRPMIGTALRDGDVVADFLHLALPGAALPAGPCHAPEPSLPLQDLAVLQVLQTALADRPARLRRRLGARMAELLAADPPPGGAVRPALHADLAVRLAEACGEDAAALDAEFFSDSPGSGASGVPPCGPPSGPMSEALQAAVARALPAPQSAAPEARPDAATLRLAAAFARLTAELAAPRAAGEQTPGDEEG